MGRIAVQFARTEGILHRDITVMFRHAGFANIQLRNKFS
jgi:hypothetical protein